MAPAPLENGGLGGEQASSARPIDTLMRALLYVAQQIGRPVGEADVRRLAALPEGNLDEQGFMAAGQRLGLQASILDLRAASLVDLPTPFAVSALDGPVHVVLSHDAGYWAVLDVITGRTARLGLCLDVGTATALHDLRPAPRPVSDVPDTGVPAP